jgi:hypothetical protein
MIAWLSSSIGATPAQAAGCHVPERPVLDSPLSWGRHGHRAAWELTDEVPTAPRVLTRVPCPGEVPQAPAVTIVAIGPALPLGVRIAPPPTGLLPTGERIAPMEPRPFRLDRPPR